MKLQPGEPLPADLPPDAQRLRRVEDDVAGGRTPIAAGVVIAMVAAAVGLAAVGAWGGFVAVPFVLAFVAMEWARREPEHAAPPRFVPDDDGEWEIAPRSVVAKSLGALAAPPKLSTWVRTLCGVLGMAFVAVIALMAKGGFAAEDAEGIASLLMAGALGAGLTYIAVRGELPFSRRTELPASPWFHSLADPSAPLPDDAPISGPRSHRLAGPSRPLDEG